MRVSFAMAFVFGVMLAIVGYPITTWQYWILSLMFVGYGEYRARIA